ncbi:rust resistance kinase Lr10-like isoform X2 [Juglans microcarpa x Juglans regia]|uniref:rust resistance kinase Lr10-like isoform X2 n=1 Tax=Juglans microcarpa x Juglans regia TaxID=2249226 RepID=UPI001B7DEF4A|nr:rust resistance kinase Lr10-like isoform X2 [Juglans microcarpa x Juglans regia]
MAISCSFFLFMVFTMMDHHVGGHENVCEELRCGGKGPAIRFHFRLSHTRQPDHCSFPGFTLSCTDSNQTLLELPISVKLFVKKINYKTQVIQLFDPNHCFPRDQLSRLNLSSSPFQFLFDEQYYYYPRGYGLFNCSQSTNQSNDMIRRISCLSDPTHQVYALKFGYDQSLMELPISSCTKMYNIPYIAEGAVTGDANILHLNWSSPDCRHCERRSKNCRILKNNNSTGESKTECFPRQRNHAKGTSTKLVIVGAILGSFLLVLLVFAIYRVYRYDKVEKENQAKIEMFLEDYRNLKPSRYTYSDIRRITNEFADKLGQGAYGTVFKGKLSNEIYVAVKILNTSKGKGEEFLNEVGTMGTIHHVNVVRLVGFCADGFRRALVYEFLSNNSLDKFISSADVKNQFLGWDKLQDIAIGIAKGIEYLHQGCDQRILHFDIKPHNILLDHNFNPKISDFGLAKLCSKDQSAVSMTTARGTMGYIAPEVFSRNFGNVTYKVDVYSFGMLLLEMVGGRKNTEVTTENISQVYFPEWIYNCLEQKEDFRVFVEDDGDAQIAKKLAIVGLWCIQWNPMNRPSMKVAVQMLEGGGNLTMPPNPFASTTTTRTNARTPAMDFRQELQVIPESE